jgi:RNA polymerase sigma-54 factor
MKSRNRITIQQTQRLTLTTSLATSMKILRSDAEGLRRYLEEQAAENPSLLLSRPPVTDWTPRWTSAFAGGGLQQEAAAAAPSLVSHALALVDRLRLKDRSARIAEALVEALEPSGWLGRPLAAIADATGTRLKEVEITLNRLQVEADPTGLFARSLAECLRLQAAEQGDLDPAMSAVLARWTDWREKPGWTRQPFAPGSARCAAMTLSRARGSSRCLPQCASLIWLRSAARRAGRWR